MLETIAGGNKVAAVAYYPAYCAELDKAAKKGVLSPNAGARRKSRTAKHIAAMA
jgi:ribosomal protein S20